jgi:uncharacterized membrane protein
MAVAETEPYARRELDRLSAFSDGVFAIAITLLVLNIEVPTVPGPKLGDALRDLWDPLLAYGIGFAVMGAFWYGHHKVFSRLARADARLVLVNLALLASIGLMPFTTALIGSYSEPLAIVAYALNVAATSILDGAIDWVAASDGLLEDQRDAGKRARLAMEDAVTRASVFIVSIPIAYTVSPQWAIRTWLLLIPVGILLGRRSARVLGP